MRQIVDASSELDARIDLVPSRDSIEVPYRLGQSPAKAYNHKYNLILKISHFIIIISNLYKLSGGEGAQFR